MRGLEVEKQQDLVSVIVPIYNMEKHLDRCLESVLGQTYQNLEVLLIDDGSTDGSLELINGYAERDPRVRVFHKENGGVSSARNLGLEMMRGEYCTFVDPDDYVADVYVERLCSVAIEYKADLVFCSYASVSPQEDGPVSRKKSSLEPRVISKESCSIWDLSSVCWGACYSKELVREQRFDETLYCGEDTLFLVGCFLRSRTCVRIDDELYAYVQYSDSASHGDFSLKKWTVLRAWKTIVDKVKDDKPILARSASAQYLMNCTFLLLDVLRTSFPDPEKVRYLIQEIRKYCWAIRYIPKEKRSIRIRVAAAIVFPRLSSQLLWIYYRRRDMKVCETQGEHVG